LGEGGAILTNDDQLAEKCMLLRNHGQQYGGAPMLCYNYRMTEAQAAFGLVQLGRLDGFNQTQRRNAKILIDNLPDGITPPCIPDYAEPTLYIIGCLAEEEFLRERFVEDMTRLGINRNLPGATIGLGYQKTLMELPLLRPYKRPCPVAEELVRHFLWFDIHRWVDETEFIKTVEKICSAWRAFI
jgi:perosamine synthetase